MTAYTNIIYVITHFDKVLNDSNYFYIILMTYFIFSGVTHDFLVSDVNDNYRLFSMLEHLLLTVGNFSEQLLYQVIKIH